MAPRQHIPGDVPDGHPGLTDKVKHAIALAKLLAPIRHAHAITDDDGPHMHHWEPILWWCRGCGEFDPPD